MRGPFGRFTLDPDAVWVLWRTFILATATAALVGLSGGTVEQVVGMFQASAFLYGALLCWHRIGIG